MIDHFRYLALAALLFLATQAPAEPPKPRTFAEIVAASVSADWRPLDPENTLYVELPKGRVVVELAPQFAPLHVANIRTLAAAHYFDGLPVLRVQENYVAQWGDPDASHARPSGIGKLAPEFDRPLAPYDEFTRLPDGDVYAPEVGFSSGFPMARDPKQKRAWLAHCYGMVGVGRDLDVDSGSGAELYVVIGHAPRHLDRNVALVGRVIEGMELFTSLPRGSGAMGFYDKDEMPVAIQSIRLASELPPSQRSDLEVIRTNTPTFLALVESRRNRPEEFFKNRAGHIDLCNVPLAVRKRH